MTLPPHPQPDPEASSRAPVRRWIASRLPRRAVLGAAVLGAALWSWPRRARAEGRRRGARAENNRQSGRSRGPIWIGHR